jgi:hypothetical protein
MRMRRSMRTLAAVVASTGCLVAAVFVAPRADGATVTTEQHCVVRVTSHDADGRMRTTDPTCAATRTDALRKAGVSLAATAEADHPIGVHYDGFGYTGSSLTVVGADCTGGWLNMPAGWSNRISSTMHGCPRIRHFDGYNLVSPEQTTLAPGANLLAMNNRTSSIQYLP